jgi:hypothetical protein
MCMMKITKHARHPGHMDRAMCTGNVPVGAMGCMHTPHVDHVHEHQCYVASGLVVCITCEGLSHLYLQLCRWSTMSRSGMVSLWCRGRSHSPRAWDAPAITIIFRTVAPRPHIPVLLHTPKDLLTSLRARNCFVYAIFLLAPC